MARVPWVVNGVYNLFEKRDGPAPGLQMETRNGIKQKREKCQKSKIVARVYGTRPVTHTSGNCVAVCRDSSIEHVAVCSGRSRRCPS